MEQFIKHFRRDAMGVWTCVSDAELSLPEGRIQVTVGSRFAKGTKFMNVDLAERLEELYWKGQDRRRGSP